MNWRWLVHPVAIGVALNIAGVHLESEPIKFMVLCGVLNATALIPAKATK